MALVNGMWFVIKSMKAPALLCVYKKQSVITLILLLFVNSYNDVLISLPLPPQLVLRVEFWWLGSAIISMVLFWKLNSLA